MKTFTQVALVLTFTGFGAHALDVTTEKEKATMSLGAQHSTEVAFDEGKTDLKQDELNELKEIVNQAKSGGQKIEEIKIISWADREYPAEGSTAAPNQQIKLADDRAEKIRNYLKKELKVSDVEVYNMAKRPNALQELFNTQTAKVKDTLEKTGSAPTTEEGTGMFGLKGKTSEALVLVYTEKK